MWNEFRFALRQIGRNKLFTLVVVVLLSVGVGANTLIFSCVNTLLLKRLPVRGPENLYLLEKMRVRQARPDVDFFYRQYEAVSRERTTLSAAVAEQEWYTGNVAPLEEADRARSVTTQIVSPNYFSELGVKAILGRVLDRRDATAASPVAAVLSRQFWASEFHSDPKTIGRIVRIKKYPFVVVGVLPGDFHGIDIERAPDIRLPISAALPLTGSLVEAPDGEQPMRFRILARVVPHVSAERAAATVLPEISRLEDPLWRDWHARNPKVYNTEDFNDVLQNERSYHLNLASVEHGISPLRDQFSRAALMLTAAAALLLIAVCANIAGLLLARFEDRRREIAIRLSVGASRARVLRQFAIENLLPAFAGASFGAAFAYFLAPVFLRLLPSSRPRGLYQYAAPLLLEVKPDARVLLFAIALALATVVLFGIVPAFRALGIDVNHELKSGTRITGSASRAATIAVQVALAMVLFAAAIDMFRTFWNLEHLNPGFDRGHVIECRLEPWNAGYSEEQTTVFLREVESRVAALPGVRAAGLASMGLMQGIGIKTTVTPHGIVQPRKTFLNTSTNLVTPGYFAAVGVPLLAGRALEASDAREKPIPIVVNTAFARVFFPHETAIGKALIEGVDGTKPATYLIVGIVGTAKLRSMREENPPIFYSPTTQENMGGVLYVRTYGDPKQIVNAVRAVVRQLDPGFPDFTTNTLEEAVQESLWQERLIALLCAFFGVVAVVLSATGLYGALAYAVARRARELGLRVALGARLKHVFETVCGRMVIAVAAGLLAGCACWAVAMRIAGTLVFGVAAIDPISAAIAAFVLLGCAMFAAMRPLLRAANSDPAAALRAE